MNTAPLINGPPQVELQVNSSAPPSTQTGVSQPNVQQTYPPYYSQYPQYMISQAGYSQGYPQGGVYPQAGYPYPPVAQYPQQVGAQQAIYPNQVQYGQQQQQQPNTGPQASQRSDGPEHDIWGCDRCPRFYLCYKWTVFTTLFLLLCWYIGYHVYMAKRSESLNKKISVSYTHLTLPTIYSV
eukprot:TRINITY_DN4995_c0_g1_i1.p1 TRINITY_DN4995_c0_g1~~TRINITY_DN4995_c0_g1_i1.p1  ORF type:complete len:182 (+),score=23.61 TRINITY_DN4995_c0_g1_i1:139-684(+)